MVAIEIPNNLVRLINGEDCYEGSTPLFSRIEIKMDEFDPFNDDHFATITLPEPAPAEELYEFESDVTLHAVAVIANRGTDGETLFLTIKEL